VAACLTVLSYMATAVISASEAMHYVHTLLHTLPIVYATIGLLAVFMILSIVGITESARVAIVIFVFHLASLSFSNDYGVILSDHPGNRFGRSKPVPGLEL